MVTLATSTSRLECQYIHGKSLVLLFAVVLGVGHDTSCVSCSGAYRHNSISALLSRQFQASGQNEPSIYFPHRLDRLTSGLMLVCRTQDSCKQMSALLSGQSQEYRPEDNSNRKQLEKVYVAKVIGNFALSFPSSYKEDIECSECIHTIDAMDEGLQRICSPEVGICYNFAEL